MGAAASIESRRPIDASDVGGSLETAKAELIRIRGVLGHLASDFGVNSVCYDASDVVFGIDEDEDRIRCIRELTHIRQLLSLNTQTSLRRRRSFPAATSFDDSKTRGGDDSKEMNGGGSSPGSSDTDFD
jgi:hypothetical protein